MLGSVPALRHPVAPNAGDGARAERPVLNAAQPDADQGQPPQAGQFAGPASPADRDARSDAAGGRGANMAMAASQLGAVAAALGAAIAEQQSAVAAAEAEAARTVRGGDSSLAASGPVRSDGRIAAARALALAAEVRRLDAHARALLAAAQGG